MNSPKVPFRHPAGGGAVVLGEGLLWLLSRMREAGDLPEDVVFKVSVFAGHGNPAGAKVKFAQILHELIQGSCPGAALSGWGPPDLAIPQP